MVKIADLNDLFKVSDYLFPSVHQRRYAPFDRCQSVTDLQTGRVHLERGEIVDGEAMKAGYDSKMLTDKYISDFTDEALRDDHLIVLPHLGRPPRKPKITLPRWPQKL